MPSTSQVQDCSVAGCSEAAVFSTRSAPSWCRAHLEELFGRTGLRPLEDPQRLKCRILAKCLTCDVHASVAFETIIEKARLGERQCAACRMGVSYPYTRPSGLVFSSVASAGQLGTAIAERAASFGFDVLQVGTRERDNLSAAQLKCRTCDIVQIEQFDSRKAATWRCRCAANPKSASRASARPNLLANSGHAATEWWDHEANAELDYRSATMGSPKIAAWRCTSRGHTFTAPIREMCRWSPRCEKCWEERQAEGAAKTQVWATTPVADNAELLAGWRDDADPIAVMIGDSGSWKFECSAGHNPRVSMVDYLLHGCQSCRANETRARADKTLAKELPEIASTWHPSLNAHWTPTDVPATSKRLMWWRDPRCGHEWQERVRNRDKYERLRCPACREILDSLGYAFPNLAAEWSPTNRTSAWMVRPTGRLPFVPSWVCATDRTHQWQAPIGTRVKGGQCPECKTAGKSAVELAHFAGAKELFANVASGPLLRSRDFVRRASWTADILIRDAAGGRDAVIEYDGAYWHGDKRDIDTDKSLDLLAAGYLVVRLREQPLEPLALQHNDYLDVPVSPSVANPAGALRVVAEWLRQHHDAPDARSSL